MKCAGQGLPFWKVLQNLFRRNMWLINSSIVRWGICFSIFKVYIQEKCCMCDQIDHLELESWTWFTLTFMDGMLVSLPGVCFGLRWAIKAGPYPVRAASEGSIQLEGLGQEGENLKGQVVYYGFPVSYARRNKVAELWESSRALLQEGAFGEEPEGLMKVRKCEPERRWSKKESQSLVQQHLTGPSSWVWSSGAILKVLLNCLGKLSPLGMFIIQSPQPVSQRFWLSRSEMGFWNLCLPVFQVSLMIG